MKVLQHADDAGGDSHDRAKNPLELGLHSRVLVNQPGKPVVGSIDKCVHNSHQRSLEGRQQEKEAKVNGNPTVNSPAGAAGLPCEVACRVNWWGSGPPDSSSKESPVQLVP